jgi:hypothetical protein
MYKTCWFIIHVIQICKKSSYPQKNTINLQRDKINITHELAKK